MKRHMKDLKLFDFPIRTYDKVRYADTDRQGHVNNAVFSSFLETGRVEFLYDPEIQDRASGNSFVIASLKLDFLQELNWPGEVHIGTGLTRIGNSSMVIFQRLFQHEKCVAEAETVIVQVDPQTRKSAPFSPMLKNALSQLLLVR